MTITGRNFVPSAGLGCSFGAPHGDTDPAYTPATFVDSSTVVCATGPREAALAVEVCISAPEMNLPSSAAAGACAPFAFYDAPTLTTVTPAAADKDAPTPLAIAAAGLPAGALQKAIEP